MSSVEQKTFQRRREKHRTGEFPAAHTKIALEPSPAAQSLLRLLRMKNTVTNPITLQRILDQIHKLTNGK